MAAIMTSQTSFTSCMHNQMLESNRDDVKLEAMRCVTVMTAKGKLSVPRTLFPHIVKNVSSKNSELKKLIYLYLTNFADQEPDMALLPVATLQKSLKSPNPLVRSSALKVLTSMRLSILSTILMATLRNSVNDLSPYVRKTVAHAIIKIYRLDPSLRSDLIEYVERLFNDKNSIVLSSAVATFEAVCPENLDLVHKHYRRFCFTLADCNEWGQTMMLNLLKRYILRLYDQAKKGELIDYIPTEHDPKILLRSAKPLIHSNNAAVVMAVIKLYIAIANYNELRSTITRPLLRLLHSQREIQLTVLNMIEELTASGENTMDERNEPESDEEDASQYSTLKDVNTEKLATSQERSIIDSQHLNNHSNEGEHLIAQQVTKDGYIPFGHENDLRPYSPSREDKYKSETGSVQDNELEYSKSNYEVKESEDVEVKQENTEEDEEDEDEDEEDEAEDEDEEEDEEEEEEEEEETDDDETEDEEYEDEDEVDDKRENDKKKSTLVSNGRLDKEGESKKVIELSFADIESKKDSSAFREVFRSYIKSFFIKHTDCTQVRLVKLRILTNLSSSVNVSLVLRELQAYVATYVSDKEFVSAVIHAIGRCAMIVKEVAYICLNGLTSLLSNNNEHIVSEAIVVLRSQIISKKPARTINENSKNELAVEGEQLEKKSENDVQANDDEKAQPEDEKSEEDRKLVSTVIKQVTKLLPTVTAPQARATILWILAEFCDKNLTAAKCAPNVLRSIAKSFGQEDNFVKLQCLTLASKFLLSLDKERKADLYQKVFLLTGYLFSLAKYDTNHDVRDRGRFLKKLLEDEEICSKVLNTGNHQITQLAIKAV